MRVPMTATAVACRFSNKHGNVQYCRVDIPRRILLFWWMVVSWLLLVELVLLLPPRSPLQQQQQQQQQQHQRPQRSTAVAVGTVVAFSTSTATTRRRPHYPLHFFFGGPATTTTTAKQLQLQPRHTTAGTRSAQPALHSFSAKSLLLLQHQSHSHTHCYYALATTTALSLDPLEDHDAPACADDDSGDQAPPGNEGNTTTTTGEDPLHLDNYDHENEALEEQGENQLSVTEKRQLSREFVQIAGPALIQLAAEPLAALVDTAYLGRLGPEVLGGAGVAISAQYAVSKLYNDPLLRTSISLVASQDGKQRGKKTTTTTTTSSSTAITKEQQQLEQQQQQEQSNKDLSIAVSSALLLAGTVGLIQLFLYTLFCRGITKSMGLTPSSPMWHSAVSYLQVRALGTPAATLWLVTNGIFRGLGDTRTPLLYSLGFSALNAILDPIFIFVWGWGASGAAAGTALAQYAALIPLLLALNRRAPIRVWGQMRELRKSLQQYVQAGGFVLFRTVGKVLAYTICARQAALLGSVAAAAYNLTFQLGVATTQICEAVAVAVQTLLARELMNPTTRQPKKAQVIRHLIRISMWAGGTVAALLSILTFFRKESVVASLTTDPAIQTAALSIFPVVLLTQVIKGLAYPVNGIVMGGLDWFYSMTVMWMANFSCLGSLYYFMLKAKGTGTLVSIEQIWWALAAFMGVQVVAGILRFESKTGIWAVLNGGSNNNRK